MPLLAKVFASIAAFFHIVFFLVESILWMNPAVHSRFFVQTLEQAELLETALFNQGFYNLFVALGCLGGIVLLQRGRTVQGTTLVIYTCLFMLGAALVLLLSDARLLRGVLIQGIPPLVALVSYILARGKGK